MAELLHHRARAMIQVDSVAATLDRIADDPLMSEQDLRHHLHHSAMILRRIMEGGRGLQDTLSERDEGQTKPSPARTSIRIRLFSERPAPADDDGPSAA